MGGSKSKTKPERNSLTKNNIVPKTEVEKKTLYTLYPPKSFANDVELRTTWPLWKNSFLKYIEQTTSAKHERGYILLNLMGPVGQSVCKEFDYKNPGDESNMNILMKKIDDYCIFGHRKKYKNENAKKYFIDLEKLAGLHNVSCVEEAIKKKVIDEIDEIQFTRTASNFMPAFTFSKFHSLDIREIAIIWDSYEKTHNYKRNNCNNNTQSELLIENCNYCGTNHMPWKCPAYGSHCKKCERQNHFEWKCQAPRCNNCKFCGGSHLASRTKCPAYNSFCSKCHQKGHFVSKCLKKHRTSKYQL